MLPKPFFSHSHHQALLMERLDKTTVVGFLTFMQLILFSFPHCIAEDHVRSIGNASSSRQHISEASSKDAAESSSREETDEPSGL